jgi:ribosomal protein S18 acetylase RimI-like enzyme
VTPTVRAYVPADRAAVIALSLRAWEPVFVSIRAAPAGSGVHEVLYADGREAAQRAAVADACDSGPVWVAEADGVVAGFVALRLHADVRMGEIHMLAVDPAQQRRGLGAHLTAFALDRMREQGMATAMVETGGDAGHAPARATYEQGGFALLPVARYFRVL